MVRQSPSRKAGATKQVESVSAHYANLVEASVSQEIEATKVSVPKHFGHSKVRESKPGLCSMIRNAIISSHFGHRGLLIWSTNTAYPPKVERTIWMRIAQILCSERDACLRSDHERVFWKTKSLRDVCHAPEQNLVPEVWSDPATLRRRF
jgi:hypothetical protein